MKNYRGILGFLSMAFSSFIPTLYLAFGDQSENFAKKYSQNIEMLATTVVGEFDGKVAEEYFSGAEECYWEQLGGAAENEVTETNGQQVYRSLDHLRRMVFTTDYELPLMLDKRSEMRTAVDFKSNYVKRTVEAYKRSKSIEIYKGVFNPAYTGKNGTTPALFDWAGQSLDIQLGALADAGLTKDKLIVAREMLKKAGYDLKDPMYKPYFSCTSREISNLLALEEATSSDYAIIRALETGERTDWLGFEFVISENVPFLNVSDEAHLVWTENAKGVRAPVNPQGMGTIEHRACFAYVKDVIGCYTSQNFTTEAGKIERYRYNWGLYGAWSHGATRRQEDGVVLVPCDQLAVL